MALHAGEKHSCAIPERSWLGCAGRCNFVIRANSFCTVAAHIPLDMVRYFMWTLFMHGLWGSSRITSFVKLLRLWMLQVKVKDVQKICGYDKATICIACMGIALR